MEEEDRPSPDASSVGSAELVRILRKAVRTMQIGVTVTDAHGRIVFVNRAEARMHGYDVQELLGRDASILGTSEVPRHLALEDLSRIESWSRESVNRRKDGSLFPVHLLSDVVTDSSGAPIGIVTTAEDITARKLVEAELKRAREELESKVVERTRELLEANVALRISEARYRLLFERNLAAVYQTDLEGRILQCNEAFSRMLGYASREDVLGRSLFELSDDRSAQEAFFLRLQQSGALSDIELRLRRKDGAPIWILENATLVTEAVSGPAAVLRTCVDITQRKQAEQRLLHDALHDSLTGLPNRALFLDRLRSLVSRARRQNSTFAVLFMDLDRFKLVNDGLGHEVGDRLLVAIAARLQPCIRDTDTLARFGGDEFTVLLEDVDGVAEATRAAGRIQEALRAPFAFEDQDLFASVSIGIAIAEGGTQSAEDLLRDADTAMYRAKVLGKSRCEVFDSEMREEAVGLLEIETDLRRALERRELVLHYQPIVSLSDGALTGFEALMRWNHPRKGLLQPVDFIPLAEETGLISAIGAWLLDDACATLRSWQDRFPKDPPLTLSVNVSSRQLASPDFVAQVEGSISRCGIDPRSLTLEITESMVLEQGEGAAALLAGIRALGVHLSLDDFGTGYSSLSYLHMLPLSKLKIDKSFVERIDTDPTRAEIVRAIVELARALDLEVIAEGVESASQRARLATFRCASAQGFYFSEAVEKSAIGGMLERAFASSEPGHGWDVRLPLA